MKENKTITVLILIIIILIGIIYNLINTSLLNNQKLILKEMSNTEYENSISELNKSYTNYSTYIQDSKIQLATAITDMGINTSSNETLETMANNIRNIPTTKDASSINYDNTNSQLISSNLQGAVDELDSNLESVEQTISKIKPVENAILCSPNPTYNMQMFTINGYCILRSQLTANSYSDITVGTDGIQYTYVVNGQTLKHGYLANF